ncbi:uncharacterized protein LOC144022970 [Festucalex cinctus]
MQAKIKGTTQTLGRGRKEKGCKNDDGWHEIGWQPHAFRFTSTPGPRGPVAALESSEPVRFLELFLTDELLQNIVEQTNLYAHQFYQADPERLPKSRGRNGDQLWMRTIPRHISTKPWQGNVAVDDWVSSSFARCPEVGASLHSTQTDLDYADVIVLLATFLDALSDALPIFSEKTLPLELEINWVKTKLQSLMDTLMVPSLVPLGHGREVEVNQGVHLPWVKVRHKWFLRSRDPASTPVGT